MLTKTDTNNNYTIGPTGSAANKIWGALDNIPANAKYVVINARVITQHSTDASAACYSKAAFLRNGSTENYGQAVGYANLASEVTESNVILFVPLDSNRIFVIYWERAITTNSANELRLMKIGYTT